MTYRGVDLTPLLTVLLTVLTSAFAWVAAKVSRAATAATNEKNAATVMLKLGALVTSILGRSWDTLAPKVQAAIADGKITDEERAALEVSVKGQLGHFIDEATLSQYADILGLPLPGLIAKIASMILDTFTKAHDPTSPTVSALAFPVAGADAGAAASDGCG